MTYIQNQKNEAGCVFCDELARPDGPGNLILHRAEYNCVILNRYPYTSGHAMVVPYEHCSEIEELDTAIRAEMMELTTRVIEVIKKEYQAQGFNVGLNIGEAAGAGISEHLHFHIVPRWKGDTNFMSTLGQTRVLPETLEDSYKRIKKAWEGETREKDD
jgi:ATP adenylyltransferase